MTDFSQTLSGLTKLTPTAIAAAPPFDMKNFEGYVPPAEVAGLDPRQDNLAAGINVHDDRPLNPDKVIKNCPHVQEAMLTHGKGYGQGLWMLDVLATTFFDDGRTWAHYMSKGHKTYTEADTDAMYDRKAGEGIGWPSCTAFENMGCKLCATCAHRGKIKSPLNLALRAVSPASASAFMKDKEGGIIPVAALMTLYKRGADKETLFNKINETYAAVRYGTEVLVASIVGRDLFFMKPEDFHRMFSNLLVYDEDADRYVAVTRLWFKWSGRRQYLGRGVIFEPGGPLEISDDMLNLWRGFGVEPKEGDWPLLKSHILNILCSAEQKHFDYLIKWMAYAVQRPSEPIGVAVALRGAQGAGKGVVARTLGSVFGKHFAHIANGELLTGRFNASVATSCVVFLDEALWAGDKKGEGVLKALITEPRLQLEAKFRDPIMVENRLRIIVASNNDWMVPAGIGDRRWFVLDVANTYAGTGHRDYWEALYAEIEDGGAAAIFYDLLAMDLSGFDVRAVPPTAAKAQQQAHTFQGTEAWLYHVLQEGEIGSKCWEDTGLTIPKMHAYQCFEDFSKRQRAWRPDIKSVWSKKIRAMLGPCVADTRPDRVRSFQFTSLALCRVRFASHTGAQKIEWDLENEVRHDGLVPDGQTVEDVGRPIEADSPLGAGDVECEPLLEPDDVEWETVDEP
jgi:hypothetical protein